MADPAWVRTPFVTAAGVDVVFYEVPDGGIAEALDPASVGEFLEWSTALLGPLPYGPELRFAGAPTAWLGFEHPANIVLQEQIDELNTAYENTAMHVTMHEIVHQWAGDEATLASAQDFAWKEAIAEYLSYVFEDEARPPAEAASSLAYWDQISLQASFHVRPMDEPPPSVEVFYGDVYGPGPMVLFVQLESLLGRDVVLDAVAAFLDGGGARSVDDLRLALEAASGEDLQPYFDAWVVGVGAPSWPAFVATAESLAPGMVTVDVTQETEGGDPFPCLIEVELQGATITQIVEIDFGLAPASGTASATVAFAEPVVAVVVDPRHRVVNRPPGAAAMPTELLPVWKF
jgi:aminopeptidase N